MAVVILYERLEARMVASVATCMRRLTGKRTLGTYVTAVSIYEPQRSTD